MAFDSNERLAIGNSIPMQEYSRIMSEGLQVLRIASSRIEAELIVGRLRSGGVRAHISADDEGGMNLALQQGRVRILISPEDEGDAHRILEESRSEIRNRKLPNRFQIWLWKRLGGRISGED